MVVCTFEYKGNPYLYAQSKRNYDMEDWNKCFIANLISIK